MENNSILWVFLAKCCGKHSDGFVASGKKVQEGMAACNILPFGTVVYIEDIGVFVIEDRGSKKYFDNQKHIDIYFEKHSDAKRFGVKYKEVEVLVER